MKKIVTYISSAVLIMILWAVAVFLATLNGRCISPLPRKNTSQAFVEAINAEIHKQFVGNFAMDQVASHMMAEGMVECSDHYARAMANYGTFISACGFTYHGPTGSIGFEPKLTKTNFRAAFTTAEGWEPMRRLKKENNKNIVSN
jgi:hypothetical protein